MAANLMEYAQREASIAPALLDEDDLEAFLAFPKESKSKH